jgi:hypothetical protein
MWPRKLNKRLAPFLHTLALLNKVQIKVGCRTANMLLSMPTPDFPGMVHASGEWSIIRTCEFESESPPIRLFSSADPGMFLAVATQMTECADESVIAARCSADDTPQCPTHPLTQNRPSIRIPLSSDAPLHPSWTKSVQ